MFAWSAYDLYKAYKNPNRTKTEIAMAWAGFIPGGKGLKVFKNVQKLGKVVKAMRYIDLSIYHARHANQKGKIIPRPLIALTLVYGKRYTDIKENRSVKVLGKYAVVHVGNKIISAHKYKIRKNRWFKH